jgi:hypothetical protein
MKVFTIEIIADAPSASEGACDPRCQHELKPVQLTIIVHEKSSSQFLGLHQAGDISLPVALADIE